jgi:hypothetical protein
MGARIPLTFQALDQALKRCVVALRIDPAAQERPSNVQNEKVEAVAVAVSAHAVDLNAIDHRLDLRSVAADFARKSDGERNIIQAH